MHCHLVEIKRCGGPFPESELIYQLDVLTLLRPCVPRLILLESLFLFISSQLPNLSFPSLSLSLSNVLSLSRQYFETFFSSFVNFPKISKFEQNVCYGLTDGIRNSFLGLKFYENISNSSSDSLSYLFLLRCFFRFHSRKKCLAHSKKKVLSLSSSSQCHATTLVWAS